MYLFPKELELVEAIRAEVHIATDLPLICSVANVFLTPSYALSRGEAEIYDRLLAELLEKSGPTLRSEVASRLAHLDDGPRRTLCALAHDRVPTVAVPVLRYSPLLSQDEIAAVARQRSSRRRSEPHLLAIAARPDLGSLITDVLTRSGSAPVLDRLSDNPTAVLSVLGRCLLARRAYRRRRAAQALQPARQEWVA
jgi:uncharacterized protein (DUF2336 family)